MAGTPEVKVRIAADSKDLDAGLAGASRSLGDFGAKIPLIGAAVAAAGAAVAAFAKGAVDEAAKAEVGMVRLGAAVSNAGGDFRKLSPDIEATVSKVMALSTATDDDLRAALTNMITITGDVGGSMKNLSLVTDVAAFSGKSLEESATLVGKAMTGNTKVLGEFGNEVKLAKEPMEALRQTVAGFAEKQANTFSGALQRINNQWGEFQEAVGKAILGGGEVTGVADALAGVLGNLALWVEKNEGAFILWRDAIGDGLSALWGLVRTVYDAVQPALGPVMKVLFGGLIAGLNTVTLGVRTLGAFFKGLAGNVLEALGTIVEKGGRLLRLFGIDAVAETGASLREAGRNMALAATDQVAAAGATYKRGMEQLLGFRAVNARQAEDMERDHQTKVTGIHARGHEERLTKAQEKAELMKLYMARANEIFAATTKALEESTRPTLRDIKADWSDIDEKVKQANKSIGISTDAQKDLAAAGESVRKKQREVLEEVEDTRDRFEDNVDSAQSLGISLIGVADKMGVIDSRAAGALTSVVNMGASIAKFGLGSPEGILSVVNGLAQLVGGWGSSPAEQARKDAHMRNTRAIEELSKDFGDYTGSASGRTFQGVLSALGGVIGDADPASMSAAQRTAFSARIKAALPQALRDIGLTENDARSLASRYNIDVDKDPMGWFRLFEVLRTRQFGAATSFTDQLSSLEESFGVLGVEDADDQLGQFGEFLNRNVPALSGVLGDTSSKGGRDAAIAKLKALYTASVTGKLAPAEYGRASPSQFRTIVSTLLRLLGSADGFLGSAQTVVPSTPPVPTGGTLPGGATSGLVTGGMAPTVSGGGGAVVSGFDLGGATIGTQNNTITLHVQPHADESSAAFAERVADIVSVRLGARYTRQLDALGVT